MDYPSALSLTTPLYLMKRTDALVLFWNGILNPLPNEAI